MIETIPLVQASAERGGPKAAALGTLLRAGLPVPAGFVLIDLASGGPASGELPLEAMRLAHSLPAPLVVRSSANLEDARRTTGAGVFRSRRDVAHEGLADAVADVLASATAPAARRYLEVADADGPAVMSVIVQAQHAGVRGTLYTRPPGKPRSTLALLQRTDRPGVIERLVEFDRRSGTSDAALDEVPAQDLAALVELADHAADLICAPSGADIEWVYDGSAFWLVQARAMGEGAIDTREPLPTFWFSFTKADPSRLWRWDARHNPEPVSTAQAGLIERVEALGLGRYEQRVVAGYLYYARRPPVSEGDPAATKAASLADFEARLAEITSAMECLYPGDAAPPTTAPLSVAAALRRYESFYALYADRLSPLLEAGRGALGCALRASGASEADANARAHAMLRAKPPRPGRLHRRLDAASTELHRTRLSFLAPAWDVAVPSFGERSTADGDALPPAIAPAEPAAVSRMWSRAAGPATVNPNAQGVADDPALASSLAITRNALTASEDDDLWFGRAQFEVRQALLGAARRAGLEHPEDIFWVPLADALALEAASCGNDDGAASGAMPGGGKVSAIAIGRLASASRAAHQRARCWRPPLAVQAGAAIPTDAPASEGTWAGAGSGGVARGTVVHWREAAGEGPAPGEGEIMVVDAVTPQLALVVRRCAAIVTAYGGPLDHAFALARELGIPCVSGVPGAVDALCDGDLVIVDGERGLVLRQLH